MNSREIIEKIEDKKMAEREYLENIILYILVNIFYLVSSGKSANYIKSRLLKNVMRIDNELYTNTAKEILYKRSISIAKNATKFYSVLSEISKNKKLIDVLKYHLDVYDTPENANAKIFISAVIFSYLRKIGAFKYLLKGVNKALNKDENDRKKKLLDALLLEGEFKEGKQFNFGKETYQTPQKEEVFYLASKHMDCAKDHIKAQGKIYVDAKWRSRIDDSEKRKKIEDFIRSHGIEALQKIISAPTYLLTRPNCRHYIQTITLENTALSESNTIDYNKMLTDYNMITKEGNRDIRQTLVYGINSKASIRNIISTYTLLDKIYSEMYKKIPSKTIWQAIVKNNILLKKWQSLV